MAGLVGGLGRLPLCWGLAGVGRRLIRLPGGGRGGMLGAGAGRVKVVVCQASGEGLWWC